MFHNAAILPDEKRRGNRPCARWEAPGCLMGVGGSGKEFRSLLNWAGWSGGKDVNDIRISGAGEFALGIDFYEE